jgi:DNA excision repair protein ERCC-2
MRRAFFFILTPFQPKNIFLLHIKIKSAREQKSAFRPVKKDPDEFGNRVYCHRIEEVAELSLTCAYFFYMVNKMVNIRISVKALVEHSLRRGDLSVHYDIPSRLSSYNNIHTHQRIQKSRPYPYDIEVPVFYSVKNDRFVLNLHGRIDGLYNIADSTVIEEIKTTARDLDDFIKENDSLHWAQLKVYAAIYAGSHRLTRITTQLTYGHIETGETRTYFREYRYDEIEFFFMNLIEQYFNWIKKIDIWYQERNQSISHSDFPFESMRSGQRQMVDDVSSIIEYEEGIIIQAPTGIGKTVAVLYPAIRAVAEGQIQKIFYLTSRTTGRLIAEKTLIELGKSGLRIKYVSLTAKEKICFNPDRNCTGEECEFAKGYFDRIREARESLFSIDAFNAEKIKEIAFAYRICPFEFSLDIALWVECIICDLNYVFNPRVYLRRFFQEKSIDCTFLIDEAHNLVDRSRDMFSAQIKKSEFLQLRRFIKNKDSDVYKIAGEINSRLLEMKKALGEGNFAYEEDRPEDLLPLLRRFTSSMERWISSFSETPLVNQMLDLYFKVHWFLRVSESFNQDYATCIEREQQDLHLKLFCKDPSDQLCEVFEKANSTILFSATITPISYFAQILGLQDTIESRILPSPFPKKNLCVLVSDTISTLYRHRSRTKEALVQTVGNLIDRKRGNYMVYFPSYEYLGIAYPMYEDAFPHHHLLRQIYQMTDREKKEFLKNFSVENDHTLVGFVVMGGIFGEGIDLAGDRLTGAVIVGVGLPGISLERELILEHYSNQQMPGFDYSYRYPGMIRVLQAAGRVIRTENDRGVILLIDKRYSHPNYSSLFPPEWQVQRVINHDHMRQILDGFWSGSYHEF